MAVKKYAIEICSKKEISKEQIRKVLNEHFEISFVGILEVVQ